jgi:5-dehydro-2-deoxygluconokinase
MLTFAKYLGGSPANTAIGMARLGLKPGHAHARGRRTQRALRARDARAEGVDVSHVITDPKRLTALAILGIRDRETFPLLFYREHCADMAIAAEDFDAQFIASSLALCVSGTHLSQPQTYAACVAAMREARNAGTRSRSISTTGRCCGD